MRKVIDALTKAELDEAELRDDGRERLLELARQKRERGEDVVEAPERLTRAEEQEGGELVDLVTLLKERLRGSARAGGVPEESARQAETCLTPHTSGAMR
jgi:hypothetical protein